MVKKIGVKIMVKIKFIKTFAIMTISICCLFVLQKDIASREDIFIRPGIGVGKLRIGETNEEINKIINRKFDDIKKIGTKDDYEMWLSYKSMGLTLIYSKEKILKRISVTHKALYLENTRISVGSSVSDIKRYSGIFKDKDRKILDIDKKRNIESWDYEKLGIKFWISWKDQRIFTIEVKEKKVDV